MNIFFTQLLFGKEINRSAIIALLSFAWLICLQPVANADQCRKNKGYLYALLKGKYHYIVGQNANSTICIFQDVSGSMAGTPSTNASSLISSVQSGAPGASVSTSAGAICPADAQWSLLGLALSQALQGGGCCAEGCNMVVISDGCSNHRNPWIAEADQRQFNSLMAGLEGARSSTNTMAIGVNGTMTALPSGQSYSNGEVNANVTGHTNIPNSGGSWNPGPIPPPPTQSQIDNIARTVVTIGGSAR